MVEVIPAEAFRHRISADPDAPIIDTRPADDFESWHIPGAVHIDYTPGDPLDQPALDAVIPSDASSVLTVCGLGISSHRFGEELEELGYPPVTVLKDGMVGWSRVYDIAEVDIDPAIRCWQIQRLAKGCLGYIVADIDTGAAVGIDIPIHIGAIIDLLDEENLSLEAVVDTHVHADHVSGGTELAAEFDVPYCISANSAERGLSLPHTPIADGETLEMGTVALEAMATPGHTSDIMCLVLADGAAVFTADTLFTDSVGRTELEDEDAAGSQARELFRSITERLFALDRSTIVLPGHFDPGGDTLRPPETPVARTLGEIREAVSILTLDEDAFVERVTGVTADRPPNYRAVILVNLGRTTRPADEVLTQLELGPNRCSAGG